MILRNNGYKKNKSLKKRDNFCCDNISDKVNKCSGDNIGHLTT